MKARDHNKSGKAEETEGSSAKIQGFLGIIALTVGNVAATITHIDEIRQYVSKILGTEWVYRLHNYILYGASAFFLLGYGCLTYWLYRNFVAHRSRPLRFAFFVAAFVAVGSTVWASYQFMFRPIDFDPLVKTQLSKHVQTILSQQVTGGSDDGGFRFAQNELSTEAQVWTTAQCLTAVLQQDIAVVREASSAVRQAFDYIDRMQLKTSDGGWGYLRNMDWGVTEIDAWVALAYVYSLRADNAVLLWKPEERAGIAAKANLALDILVKRQHDDGGWSVIEKTPEPRHLRTYSSIMAIWAIAEAAQNGDVLKGRQEQYRKALVLGAKWLLQSYTAGSSAFSGWWPNPSAKPPVGEYPGLTAQVLFALSEAKMSNAFIGADPKYKEAIEGFIKLALEGNDSFVPLTKRKVGDNEQAHDSDRYLFGRPETVEQSKFLWYPWTMVVAAALQNDSLLQEYQHEQLRGLLSKLLERNDEKNKFIRNDQAIYPTAEALFAEGYYFSKNAVAAGLK